MAGRWAYRWAANFAPWDNPKLEPGPDGESLPLRLGRETVRFIGDNRHQPFLAYLSFYSVHGPIQTSRDRWERFRAKAVSMGAERQRRRFRFDGSRPVRLVEDCPIYAGMIEAMDEAVGLVLDALERFGLADNTIVCFTSDNGGAATGDAFSASMLPLRGGKGTPVGGRHPRAAVRPLSRRGGAGDHVRGTGVGYRFLPHAAGLGRSGPA